MSASEGFSSVSERFFSSSIGQAVMLIGVVAAVWALGDASQVLGGVIGLLSVALLWVHCVEPALVHFRAPRSVLWFAAAWTIFEFVLIDIHIASELSSGFQISRQQLLVGVLISIAYVVVVGLSFWPRYSILVRLLHRNPT